MEREIFEKEFSNAHDDAIKRRELTLRERELALRERDEVKN